MSRVYSVDIAGGNDVVDEIKECVESTYNDNVVQNWGSFGGLFDVNFLKEYHHPILVSSCDGTGSKILLSKKMNRLDTIGEDIVNHCINDILVQGAKPLFFLDTVSSAKLNKSDTVKVIKGVAKACKDNNVALLGGETAEIKQLYQKNVINLEGTIVGVLEKHRLIDGKTYVNKGNVVMALPSSGFHTNGYTVVNQYADQYKGNTDLLASHRCYIKEYQTAVEHKIDVNAMVHVTGGGLTNNPKRVLPKGCFICWERTWKVPEIFTWIQTVSNCSEAEMWEIFNMGLGFLFIISPEQEELFKQVIPESFRVGLIK